jgi:hypothetical protein
MDRFAITLKKDPSPWYLDANQKPIGIDQDFPPSGIPYRVVTQELENSGMDHEMYMEAVNIAAKMSNNAGSSGEKLFSVRLMRNAMTEKFEIQLIFLKLSEKKPCRDIWVEKTFAGKEEIQAFCNRNDLTLHEIDRSNVRRS